MRGLLASLALFATLPAWSNGLSLAPSPAQGCLTSTTGARGTPEYPALLWQRGTGGRVKVDLIFTGPELRPEVKVLDSQGGDEFVDAVQAHARLLRVPCLQPADIPARLRLDFVFKPTERSGPAPVAIDPDVAEQRRQLQCVTHRNDRKPDYPMAALRREVQGRLLLRVSFTSADGSPEVTVLSRPASEVFVSAAREWAQNFRMPCFGGRPVLTEYLLIYRLQGSGDFGFRNVSLKQFVGNIRGIAQQLVFFDFNTMGCPFEVRLKYLQPLLRNQAEEVNEPNPLRRPFLDWLEGVTLELTERAADAVFGDSVLLPIPCTKIDLQPSSTTPPTPPKEKS